MKINYKQLPEKQEQGYGITRWADPNDVRESLKAMQETNIYAVPKVKYDEIVNDYFDKKCAGSKKITTEAKNYIPGGVQHNLAFNKPFPMCMTKAEGAYLTDIDNNKYIDFLQAGGPTILGSNYPIVKDAAIKLINECGPVTGLFHEAELLIAKEINKHMPNVEKFRMLGSGTESVMGALRIARNYTHNKRIIKIGGAYHGWSDQMVYGLKVPGTRQFLESFGIPNTAFKYIDEVRPDDLEMLESYLKKNRLKGGTAAVILEPVGPESGTRPIAWDYNAKALELAHKYGALLIFDEVVTGFRVGPGGAQGLFDIKPDLTIFGKIVAGGYPAAGGIGGRKELVDLMASGVGTGAKKAYVGGTLAANPLSCIAGYTAIKEIVRTDACLKAGLAGNALNDGLVKLIEAYDLPYVAYNQGSIVHLECVGPMSYDYSSSNILKSLLSILKKKPEIMVRTEAMKEMGAVYMANGLVTLAGSRLYTSMADTPEIIDDALNRFEDVFKLVKVRDTSIEQQVEQYKIAKAASKAAQKANLAKK